MNNERNKTTGCDKMFVDRKKLSDITTRDYVTLTFKKTLIRAAGFRPGQSVNIIFDNGKIIIVNDARQFVKDNIKLDLKIEDLDVTKL